jgi:hypothetical protein
MCPADLEHGLFWNLKQYIELVEALPTQYPVELEKSGLTLQDLRVWLAAKRDNLSLAEIARREYAPFWDEDQSRKENQKALSVVRRAVSRVEKFLNRDGDEFVYPRRKLQDHPETLAICSAYEVTEQPKPRSKVPKRRLRK